MTLYVVEYEKIIISFSLFLTKKIPQMIESWQFYIFSFLIGNLKCISLWKNKFQMLRCQWFNGKWSKVRGVLERVLRGSNERIIGEHNFIFFPISFDKKWFLFIVLNRNLSNLNLNNDFEALGDDMCYENTVVSRPLIMDKRGLIHVNLVFMTLQV